jgi:acyl-coenzyme A synthetase/AMP-(fatty) acid ligase
MLYGRLDSQAKIQGYRVELGEIEHHAREFLKGHNAVVLTFVNSIGNHELAMFFEGRDTDITVLIDHLKTKLPHYMIPVKTIAEAELPLNSNGKIDKVKLRERLTN